MASLDTNISPYYDDHSVDSPYYKILFKPGFAVQNRELHQIQTILDRQIETLGKHIFKEGDMVIPGSTSVDTSVKHVKIQGVWTSAEVRALVGKTIIGNGSIINSGISATVIHAIENEGTEPATLFVRYLDSGNDNISKSFLDNEMLREYDEITQEYIEVATSLSSNSTGDASLASITRGWYFIKNLFVLVLDQTIVLDKYSNTPSYKIGLDAIESFVSSEEDPTLLDNAQGTPNFAAPGADRYSVVLQFVKKSRLETTDKENFIQLIVVENGNVLQKVSYTDYNIIEQTMARRTFDESGDYTVKNFQLDVREYRNNFRGDWEASTHYLAGDIVLSSGRYYKARRNGTSNSTPPTQTVGSSTTVTTGIIWTLEASPNFNRGVYTPTSDQTLNQHIENSEKLALGLEAGKAYVRGYEIEKIAKEYITVSKARTSIQKTNASVPTDIGNYVSITNLHALPNLKTFPVVSLYNQLGSVGGTDGVVHGTLVGYARVRFIEFTSGTQGTPSGTYKASLFDVKMIGDYTFDRDVKRLFLLGGNAVTSFSADIVPELVQVSGSITTTGTSVSGTGTLFNTELKVGDYIAAIVGANVEYRRVASISSNQAITLSTAFTSNVVNSVYGRVGTSILESSSSPLLFPLPSTFVKSVRDADNNSDISYTVYEQFTGRTSLLVSVGIYSFTLSATNASDTFESGSIPSNYLILDESTGELVPATSVISIADSGQQATITISAPAVRSYSVIAAVKKQGSSTEKVKTLTTETITISNPNSISSSSISLGRADGFRLLSIKKDTGSFASPTGAFNTDITNKYDFNNGQTLSFYGLASIELKVGESVPNAPIQVTFEYFNHSASGDYFSVNSYLTTISYDEIPTISSISLGEFLDFRPRINSSGTLFEGTTLLPKRGFDIQCDFQHYIPRVDKVVLDQNGNFYNIYGTPSIKPEEPADSSTGMVIYKTFLPPYTKTTSSVKYESIDNKRYTMRDIGKIDKRLENVEYYTSLSLLEQEAKSLEITDEFGLTRFKNGFIVDNFTGHNIGDVTSQDYDCSVDMENGHLRPTFFMDNVNMIEANTSDAERQSDLYQVTGDLVTLPYTEVPMIEQLEASRVENVNPFAIFTFIGDIELNPPTDEWFEVNRLPDIVNNVGGNFDAVYAQLEALGSLGTVWNAWQTQWTGASSTSTTQFTASSREDTHWWNNNISVAEANSLYGSGPNTRTAEWQIRQITVETTATQVGVSRTGIRTTVVPKVTTETTDDRTISRAVIPFIRSRKVLFVVKGLKPSTKFYPFFDGVEIGQYITPALRVTVSGSDVFDSTSKAGGNSDEPGRRFNEQADVSLDRGDVVFVKQRGATVYTKSNSPCTAVLALDSTAGESSTILHLVNKLGGNFQNGDILEGSISGVTAVVTSVGSTPSIGGELVTTSKGDICGIYDIPNTDSIRFRTGVREFKVSDHPTDSIQRTSSARADYSAQGIVETKQATITSTRNAEVRQEAVSENSTIIQEATRIITDTGWYDPLSQTFLVDSDGGAFITSVDIWFASKDSNLPVILEIREVVNGYPGKSVLPFSRTSKQSSSVIVANTQVETADGKLISSPTVPTTFKFASPVFLNNKTEYCIVLLSDSNKYQVWISQLGDKSIITGNVISEQPYAGVLFKSQNASTWTADQNQDLMFRINKAKFVTEQYGEAVFMNTRIAPRQLRKDPFYTVAGSNKIRVSHENHGMFVGSKTTFTGSEAFAGIVVGKINTIHTIISTEIDSYIIEIPTDTWTGSTFTGNFGGSSVMATRNIAYNTLQPIISQLIFPETEMTHHFRGTSGKSVHGTETPYQIPSVFDVVSANENNNLSTLQIVANSNTEAEFMGNKKSVELMCRLISYNENLSPVVDTSRFSIITIQDRIDNPTEDNINFDELDLRVVSTNKNNISASGNKISSIDVDTRAQFKTLDIGKYVIITGFSNTVNNGKFMITNMNFDGEWFEVDANLTTESAGASVSISVLDRFVDEISPLGSSSVAKYISKKIKLDSTNEFLKVRFAADVEQLAGFTLFYKTDSVGSDVPFDNIPYIEASPSLRAVKSDNGKFTDVEYDISTSPFSAVQVKIVMNSTWGADIVRFRDLMIVATV